MFSKILAEFWPFASVGIIQIGITPRLSLEASICWGHSVLQTPALGFYNSFFFSFWKVKTATISPHSKIDK